MRDTLNSIVYYDSFCTEYNISMTGRSQPRDPGSRVRCFLPAPQSLLAGCVLSAFAALAYSLDAQYGQGLAPCPLCMAQRYALGGLAVVLLSRWLLRMPSSRLARLCALGIALFAVLGIAAAGWQLWLQLSATPVRGCTEATGVLALLGKVLGGSGDCASADWLFLGVTAPAWTLALFVAIGGTALWAVTKLDKIKAAGT